MNLQQLNNLIHSSTKNDLELNFHAWKSELESLVTGESYETKNYYSNHTGRELFKKLSNMGSGESIYDSYDSGFRPTTYDFS